MHKKILTTFCSFLLLLSLPASAQAKTSLQLSPAETSQPPGQIFDLELKIEAEETVVAADLVIVFNPQEINLVKVTPGSFLPTPQVLINTLAEDTGEAYFSLFGYPGAKGSGQLIKIQARILKENLQDSIIKISEKTLLAGSKGKKLVFSALPAKITSAVFTPLDEDTMTSPAPTSFSQQPTIFLIGEPTPKPAAGKNFPAPTLAFLLLIVGGLAIFLLKIKQRQNVKE